MFNNKILPKDLYEAELLAYHSLIKSLEDSKNNRKSFNYKFEGIKIMPLALRLISKFIEANISTIFIWPDTGSTALAKNQITVNYQNLFSYKEFQSNNLSKVSDCLLVAITPKYFDYELFEQISLEYKGPILSINPKLEEPNVGIGSVARKRRKEFISSWENTFWIEPLEKGALMRIYPQDWTFFKYYTEGYRYQNSFSRKPTSEEIFESML